ncbi:DUF4286 family protein [Mucilaginibacter antarcticus]|uniref:DUF4286 family protein n=2 Tax=Mucilaginibacter antarcticus TaxID=1855725 RepID=A0ABW5XHM6_9SPHI
MITYNETVIVDEGVHKQWLSWVKTEYIPMVIKTGFFNSFKILNVLDSPNEGVTYCLQFFTDSREKYNEYNVHHFLGIQTLHQQKFENKFVLFNTLMQSIN